MTGVRADAGRAVERADSSIFRSLRVRNFRLFAVGETISLSGIFVQGVAQSWLVLRLADNPGAALGIVTGLQLLPMLLFGLYVGVLADRYPKRRLLVCSRVTVALMALTVGLLDVTGLISLWTVYVFAVMLGLVTAVEEPTVQAFVVEIVGRRLLVNALSLNSAIFNLAKTFGPALAGVMISLVDTGPVFLITAVSAAWSVVALLLMRPRELLPTETVARSPGQIRAVLAYVRGEPQILWTIVLVTAIGTFGLNFQIILPLLATDVFDHGSAGYGLLQTGFAVGSLAAALVAARRVSFRMRLVVGSAFLFGLLEVVASLMPGYLAFLALFVASGCAFYTFYTAANASVQLTAVSSMRGRVMALLMIALSFPIGAPLSGWFAGVAGPRASLGVGGALITLVAVGVALALANARRA
jgi:MFS family permease